MGRAAWSTVFLSLLCGSTSAQAEKPDSPSGSSLEFGVGIHASYLLPFGHWTDHAMAGTAVPESLDQFGSGAGGGLELVWRFRHRVSLILVGEMGQLDVGAWERYSRRMGTPVKAWALQWSVMALAEVDVLFLGPVRVALLAGAGAWGVSGAERILDYDVRIDYQAFLLPTIALRGGLTLRYRVARWLELALECSQTSGVGGGVRYEGERTWRPLLGVSVSLGARFYLVTPDRWRRKPSWGWR